MTATTTTAPRALALARASSTSSSTTTTTTRSFVKTRATRSRTDAPTSKASRRSAILSVVMMGAATTNALAVDNARAQTNARAIMEPEGEIAIGLDGGRVRGCPREHNCVSTSSRESDKYAAPWSASNTFRDAKDAANALVDVTLETVPDARLMTRVDREDGTFLGFSTPGKLGEDVVEFWIKNEAVSDRDWEGDQGNGPLVLYRSFAVDVKYVYPFMTPVGDFGAQSQRLRSIREALGWQILGCELIECFQ